MLGPLGSSAWARLAGTAGFAGILLAAHPAAAEDSAETAGDGASEEAGSDDKEPDLGHGFQFGLRGAVLGGYRMVFGYDESPLCAEFEPQKGTDQQKICGFMGPPLLDLGLSFAPLDSIEPFLWGRLGLGGEDRTGTDALKVLGAGVRIYTMSDAQFKIFVEPSVGLELEGGDEAQLNYLLEPNANYGTDFLFRMAAGPQFEIGRHVGIYAQAGMTVGILRAIHSTLEFGVGLQLRAP
jgi:hypothetical protein